MKFHELFQRYCCWQSLLEHRFNKEETLMNQSIDDSEANSFPSAGKNKPSWYNLIGVKNLNAR
jgi:Gpi18-like mannosyltransferase